MYLEKQDAEQVKPSFMKTLTKWIIWTHYRKMV